MSQRRMQRAMLLWLRALSKSLMFHLIIKFSKRIFPVINTKPLLFQCKFLTERHFMEQHLSRFLSLLLGTIIIGNFIELPKCVGIAMSILYGLSQTWSSKQPYAVSNIISRPFFLLQIAYKVDLNKMQICRSLEYSCSPWSPPSVYNAVGENPCP